MSKSHVTTPEDLVQIEGFRLTRRGSEHLLNKLSMYSGIGDLQLWELTPLAPCENCGTLIVEATNNNGMTASIQISCGQWSRK